MDAGTRGTSDVEATLLATGWQRLLLAGAVVAAVAGPFRTALAGVVIAKLAFYIWTIATKDSFTLVIARLRLRPCRRRAGRLGRQAERADARHVVDHGRAGGRGRGRVIQWAAWHPTSTSPQRPLPCGAMASLYLLYRGGLLLRDMQ